MLPPGCSSVLTAVTPTDIDGPLCIKMATDIDGVRVPGAPAINFVFPSQRDRARLITAAPAACAEYYALVVRTVFESFVGLDAGSSKSGEALCDRAPGLLGVPLTYFVVTEEVSHCWRYDTHSSHWGSASRPYCYIVVV